jgi:hypothetical protein
MRGVLVPHHNFRIYRKLLTVIRTCARVSQRTYKTNVRGSAYSFRWGMVWKPRDKIIGEATTWVDSTFSSRKCFGLRRAENI